MLGVCDLFDWYAAAHIKLSVLQSQPMLMGWSKCPVPIAPTIPRVSRDSVPTWQLTTISRFSNVQHAVGACSFSWGCVPLLYIDRRCNKCQCASFLSTVKTVFD